MSEIKVDLLRGRSKPDRPPAVQKSEFVSTRWGGPITTNVPRSSFNVTSITDNAVGFSTANFTTPYQSSTSYNTSCMSVATSTYTNTRGDLVAAAAGSIQMRHIENGTGYDTGSFDFLLVGALS